MRPLAALVLLAVAGALGAAMLMQDGSEAVVTEDRRHIWVSASSRPEPALSAPAAADRSAPCRSRRTAYDLGPRFRELDRTHTNARCPQYIAAVHSIYGTCVASSDMGCSPPLQVQTWRACERSPADYRFGEPETAGVRKPSRTVTVRGVTGRFYGGRLEIVTGDATVVLFGPPSELVAAAQELRTTRRSPEAVSAGKRLPAPVRGAVDGTLRC